MENLKTISNKELLSEISRRFDESAKFMLEQISLYETLESVNKKLLESEELKSHFLSNIRNEIVNPFASIIALSKHIVRSNKEDWKSVISIAALIHSEAFFLDFQLKNIFMAAEIESGESNIHVSKVNLVSLIESLIDSYMHIINEKKIKVNFINHFGSEKGAPFYFRTDADKIQLIISNLLCNAIQFSKIESGISVEAGIVNELLAISIKDSGEGIKEENHKFIFGRFNKLDNNINDVNKGYGLGLTVCQELVNLFNGSVSLESRENEGSTFRILIPESAEGTMNVVDDGNEMFFKDSQIF